MIIVYPGNPWVSSSRIDGGKPLPHGASYTSDTNTWWLTCKEFSSLTEAET
jgi:hypothetical protein